MVLTKRMIRDLLFFKGAMSLDDLMTHYNLKHTPDTKLKVSGLLVKLYERGEVLQNSSNEWYCIVHVKG